MKISASQDMNVWVSSAEAASSVRLLRAWSAAQCTALSDALRLRLDTWRPRWTPDLTPADSDKPPELHDLGECLKGGAWNPNWYQAPLSAGRGRVLWQRLGEGRERTRTADDDAVCRDFTAALWQEKVAGEVLRSKPEEMSLASELGELAWADLCACLQGHASAKDRPSAESIHWDQPGFFEGFLFMEFSLRSFSARFALDPAAIDLLMAGADPSRPDPLPPGPPPCQPVRLDLPLHAHTLGLHAHLNPLSIAIGRLRDLRVGDVLLLDHPVDSPSHLHSDNQETVGSGWLGQADGFKTIELA